MNYSSCNEDGVAEQRALRVAPGDVVCCITGSGDRVLHLLLGDPDRVYALDMNPAQNYLLELKMAAIRAFDYEAYARFLGLLDASAAQRLSAYADVRPQLTPTAAAFFDRRRRAIADGILYSGRWERFFGLASRNLRLQRGGKVERLLSCKTLDEQRRFLRREWDTAGWRLALRLTFSRPVIRFAFGDPGFYSHVARTEPAWQYVHGRINRYLERHLARESFMMALVLKGRFFDPAHYPPYLRAENFETLKARLDRIALRTTPLFDFLTTDEARACTAFSLSDVSSFLDEAAYERLFAWFASRTWSVRFCLRDFLTRRPLPRASVTGGLRFLTELQSELEDADESIGYTFVIGEQA